MRVPRHSYFWHCHNNNQLTWRGIPLFAVEKPPAEKQRERINYSTHRLRYTYKLRTACIEMKRAGTLNVSKKISAAFSRLMLGFRGASVSSTGCYQRRSGQRSIADDQKKGIMSNVWPKSSCGLMRGAHLLWKSLQLLFGVNILPNSLHVIPVLHDPVLHRVPNRQQAPVFLITRG